MYEPSQKTKIWKRTFIHVVQAYLANLLLEPVYRHMEKFIQIITVIITKLKQILQSLLINR